jgi:hypothetical protein
LAGTIIERVSVGGGFGEGEECVPADSEKILELASYLMPEDPSLAQEVRLAITSADEYVIRFQERLRDRGIEKPQSDLPEIALVDGLEARGRLKELDKKQAAEDIALYVDRLLSSQPAQPGRWVWLATAEWWDKVPDDVLPAIAVRLAEEGFAVVTIDIASDSYPMMILPISQVGECQRLAQLAGSFITDWRDPPVTG